MATDPEDPDCIKNYMMSGGIDTAYLGKIPGFILGQVALGEVLVDLIEH